MGIHGIYKEIGPGERIALSKLAAQKYEKTGRPLRLAIDTSIWLFQVQSGKGGTNPALRTFFYRLLRLLSLSIHPLFIFDGPNKPPFKRNKRTGQNFASVPDFLAKQLLQQFGFPYHRAPGEAEAECALLQRKGVVDAVLSEDVDTLMFGSGVTIRNWSTELKSNGTPTHVNVYDAQSIKAGPSRLDPTGMILVGLMSGGDYTPQGIPGCGPKTACEAARAGFGAQLCEIPRRDKSAIRAWRDKLAHELKTNEGKHFRQKHKSLQIPEDFPSLDVLGYYTHPAVSDDAAIEKLQDSIRWDQDMDLPALRAFTAEAFDWTKLQGAKHFIRNLAPAILRKELRMAAKNFRSGDVEAMQEQESKLVRKIYSMRNHASTDHCVELRIGFMPLELVPLALEDEEPDDEGDPSQEEIDGDEQMLEDDIDAERPECAGKKRTATNYEPSRLDRAWVLDTFVKSGVPLTAEDWEENMRAAERLKQAKAARSLANQSSRQARSPRSKKTGGMHRGALHQYAKVTKPVDKPTRSSVKPQTPILEELDLSGVPESSISSSDHLRPTGPDTVQSRLMEPGVQTINLCSSPAPSSTQHLNPPQQLGRLNLELIEAGLAPLPSDAGQRKRSPFRRSISTPESRCTKGNGALSQQPTSPQPIAQTYEYFRDPIHVPSSPPPRETAPSQVSLQAQKTVKTDGGPDRRIGSTCPSTPSRRAASRPAANAILLSSPSGSSPGKQRMIREFFPPGQASDSLQQTRQDISSRRPWRNVRKLTASTRS
ncbi:hypothetical protein EV356DRAFT_215388 [Viridothelium virens]|uniref:PIN domain-like protein n=1 Tax=Viridothelium virens TaxID=1048519 RepID=A0A6A6H548_VIRVR|nr:hypothetical protein EV356DRAFT_215388 [Viridothelium virens]